MTTDVTNCYPTCAYDQLDAIEQQAVEDYIAYIIKDRQDKHQSIISALNLPIPSEYIKRSRQALNKPVVKAALAERIREEANTQDINADRVIREYAKIAFADITDFLQPGNGGGMTIKQLTEIPLDKSSAIKSIETKPGTGGTVYKISMHDKLPALKTLSEMMGLTAPERPPVLKEFVKEELREIQQKQLEAPEVAYTELLEEITK